jgi:hypothetical protein
MSRRRTSPRRRLWQSAGMLLAAALFLGAVYGLGVLAVAVSRAVTR